MQQNLNKYNEKRNFAKTKEPDGKSEKQDTGKYPVFVVQHHVASRDHYDFRLEHNGVLLSWAVPKGPSFDPGDRRLAVRVEDHPFDYRNFEGTIPKGQYGGGTVMLWDEGVWASQPGVDESLKTGSLKFVLSGERLKGLWTLVKMTQKQGETADNWLLIKEKDGFALTEPGIKNYETSVRTGRTMEEIANSGV